MWLPGTVTSVTHDTVVVSVYGVGVNAEVDQLRYAYRNNPCLQQQADGSWLGSQCLLYNSEGLPAAPFILPIV